jgi:dienelactone hydrolase
MMPATQAVLASLALMTWLSLATAHADALVRFPNVPGHPFPPYLLGYLARPDGPGPFPAVVVLHGCNGFSSASAAIADDLKTFGYVALTVDSLGPRDSSGECDRFFVGQEIDAYAALAHLSQLPFVDSNRIALLGTSMGGYSALLAVQRGALEKKFDHKFRAAIAYYPSCHGFSAIMTVPTMILIGDADDWTPAEACRKMIAQWTGEGDRIALVVYPGAYHGFNFPQLEPGAGFLGHWLQYDKRAATDAWEKVTTILATNLGTRPSDVPSRAQRTR